MVYVTRGHATFEQQGLWDVGPGDVLVIPAGRPHRRVSSNESEYWGLGICLPCFGNEFDAGVLDPFEAVRNGASAVASIRPDRQSFTVNLLQELAAHCDAPNAATPLIQRSLLALILNEVVTARGSTAPAAEADAGLVGETLRFIEGHCLQPLSLQQVARAVGKSPAYVTTTLSRATGKSAVEWITAYRMAQARTLLHKSRESVSAIAERVGYGDTTHFIRMFRRETGVTPAAFRATRRQATIEPTSATTALASQAPLEFTARPKRD